MAKQITLDKKTSEEISKKLSNFLADSFVLYVKTLNYHWNMKGDGFFMYHRLLEEQYKEMSQGIDELAERIRMLGSLPPSTMKEFLELTLLKEGKKKLTQLQMVGDLSKDNLMIVEHGHQIIAFTDEKEDQGTSDLLIERIRAHDKNSWLLRSHLERK